MYRGHTRDPAQSFLQRFITRLGCRLVGCALSGVLTVLIVPCVIGLSYFAQHLDIDPPGTSPAEQIEKTRPRHVRIKPPAQTIPVKVIVTQEFEGVALTVQNSTQPLGFYHLGAKLKNGTEKAVDNVGVQIRLLDRKGQMVFQRNQPIKPSYMGVPIQPGEVALVTSLVDARGKDAHRVELRLTSMDLSVPTDRPKGKSRRLKWLVPRPKRVKVDMRVLDSVKKDSRTADSGRVSHDLLLQLTNSGTVPVLQLNLQKRLFDADRAPVAVANWQAVPRDVALEPGDTIVVKIPSYNHRPHKRYSVHVVVVGTSLRPPQ